MERSACRGVSRDSDCDPFFPGGNNDLLVIALTEYCSVCPVLKECGAFADRFNIEYGVWGGVKRTKKSDPKVS